MARLNDVGCAPSVQSVQSVAQNFLVLPEGTVSECLFLFGFALECARRLPDTRFIFRTHPVLPFDRIKGKLSWPENVEVSQNPKIEDDFARAGYILYRGSSTVLYGVLAGLKPFYVSKPGEVNFDPLYELQCWRESVQSVEELIAHYRAHTSNADWPIARDYCSDYVLPIQDTAIDEILEHKSVESVAVNLL
jgi:hypothetical protein